MIERPLGASLESSEWPVCPNCGQPRQSSCPACGTAGTDFQAADAGSAQLPLPADEPTLRGLAAESLPGPRVCPLCDEVFHPRFYRYCHVCDFDFGDGMVPFAASARSARRPVNRRIWLAATIAGIVLAAILTYFWWLLRSV